MDHLMTNIETLVDAVEDCRAANRVLPSLSLLYTGMDVMGSLESLPGEGTKQSFTRWVDKHVVRPGNLPCTALELYAARCGVVHTFTPESNLFRQGQVRRVFYAWGSARSEDLQQAIDTLGSPAVVVPAPCRPRR